MCSIIARESQKNLRKNHSDMENIDPVYECDAPLYVDFEQIKQSGGLEDDGADSWFGEY